MKTMSLAIIIATSLALSACSTIGAPETPGQRLYAAYGAYSVSLAGAADYVETPLADPKIVSTLNKANKKAKPAVDFAKAYVACKGQNATVTPLANCAIWNFQPGSVLSYATTLRSVATSLLLRGN